MGLIRRSDPVRLHSVDPEIVRNELRPTWISRGLDFLLGNGLAVLSLAFVSVAAGIPVRGAVLSLIAGVLGGIGAFHMLRRAIGGRPVIEWDEDGFTDRTSLLGGELQIRWEDVKEVTVRRSNAGVRIEFEDHPEPDRRRLLTRVWVAVPNSRALDPRFAEHFGATAAGAVRGGMRESKTSE